MTLTGKWIAWGACLLLWAGQALADGLITHLSGEVSVQQADGQKTPATMGSKVAVGNSVVTGANGYARLEMSDSSEMVLRPNSHLKIDEYRFKKEEPKEDSFVFNVIKGGFRTVTGLIGKRGNKDAYQAKTPAATIGIRGTQYDLRLCQGDCGALKDGTYLSVRFGAVNAANSAGAKDIVAGQVGHVPPNQPPVILPRDPGVGFTPPPVIPKLDEKKKQQAAEKSGDAAPAQKTAPDEKKAEADKPAVKEDKKGDGKGDAKTAAKADSKAEEGKPAAKTEPAAAPKADAAPAAAAPAQAQAQGLTCTLQ